MQELVIMKERQAVTSSLMIAEVFKKRHSHVIEAIENKIRLAENSADYNSMFVESTYVDKSNREQKQYYMNRDGFTFIAFGFTGKEADEFKLKYINAFNQMEKALIPTNPMDALRLMFEAQDQSVRQLEEHDNRLYDLEENTSLSPSEYNAISQSVSNRVNFVIKQSHKTFSKQQKSEMFKALNSDIKKITGVNTRSNLRQKHFDDVYNFIKDWHPSQATLISIENLNKNEDI